MSRFEVMQISPDAWRERFAASAHLAAFGKVRPACLDRISYALLVIDTQKDAPVAYMTARETDGESVYWQFGGGLKPHFQPAHTLLIYDQLVAWHSGRYKRASTLINNGNINYLKIALKAGFRIIGIKYVKDQVLLELLKSFEEDT